MDDKTMSIEEARKILFAVRNDCRGYPRDLRFDPTRTEIAQAIETLLNIGSHKHCTV